MIAVPAPVVRTLLVIAVGIGIAVDAFFAIVNFYPVAPHPNRGPKRYVVMQLDEVQAAWFQANILDDFNLEADANLEVLRVSDEEQLQAATLDAAKHDKEVVLTALPVTQIANAMTTKLVKPFADVVGAKTINQDFGALGDSVLAAGKVGTTQFFLPRMAVIDVAVYRVSKVRDAVLHWAVLRPQINAALKAINGRGLPDGYELGLTPATWSSYDLFVMAFYWSHRSYAGQPARPRVAHRTGDEIDGQRDIVSAIYRMGATDATIGSFDSRAAVDFFQWEALYRSEGLYDEDMYGAEPFDDEAVIDGLQKGELFFAPIDAMEAFNLHGGSHVGAQAHVDDPADLEFTSMPHGASLALDEKGSPARSRPTFSFREDWVWALPASAKATGIAYKLVQFLWRPEIHARECEALGMLPLHPAIVAERVSRFRLDWMSHVFEAGLEQARHGEPTPPALIEKGYGSVYAQLWAAIVPGKLATEPAIAAALHAPPKPKPLKVIPVALAAKQDKPETKVDEAPQPPSENEDWETDVVLQNVGSGAKP